MNALPLLVDDQEALAYLAKVQEPNDALLAYIVRILVDEGYSNRRIGEVLGFDKAYTVTHYKRCGMRFSEEELRLWFNNPQRITLGHARMLASLSERDRDHWIRTVIQLKLSIASLKAKIGGEKDPGDIDVAGYAERMSEHIHRGVAIKFDKKNYCGKITLDYYGLDDLDDIAAKLGFQTSENEEF